jgi:hypothetical protein
MVTFDHVLHLYLDDVDGKQRTFVRVLKSSTARFSREATPLVV